MDPIPLGVAHNSVRVFADFIEAGARAHTHAHMHYKHTDQHTSQALQVECDPIPLGVAHNQVRALADFTEACEVIAVQKGQDVREQLRRQCE